MARVGAYLRRSTKGDEDKNYSLEAQEIDVRTWADQHGHNLVAVFSDPGGTSWTLDRPVLQDALAAARRGEFDILAVGRYDRLSRDMDDLGAVIKQFEGYGCSVLSVDMGEQLVAGIAGKFQRQAIAFITESELIGIRARTNGGKAARLRAGKLPAAATPLYGYTWADEHERRGKSRYVPDMASPDGNPDHAPAQVVRWIFTMIADGVTLRQMAHRLEADRIPPPRLLSRLRGQQTGHNAVSAHWNAATLQRMLRNPAYVGRMVVNRRQSFRVGERHPVTGLRVRRRTEVIRAADDAALVTLPATTCPALIDETTWTAVQAQLVASKHEWGAVRAAAQADGRPPLDTLLLRGGHAVCGYCGHVMRSRWSAKGRSYRYVCGNEDRHTNAEGGRFSRQAAELDALTWQWLMAQLEHPELVQRQIDELQASFQARRSLDRDRLAALRHEYDEAETDAKGAERAVIRALDDREAARYQVTARESREHCERLAEDIQSLEIDMDASEALTALPTFWAEAVEADRDYLLWGEPTIADKRHLIERLRVKVTCRRKSEGDDALTFSWALGAEVSPATTGASV